MDDMKKLVEKYKRELMEYSRSAAVPEKLSFPEMLPEEPAEPAEPAFTEERTAASPDNQSYGEQTDFSTSAQDEQEQRKPRIVGYSDNKDALNSLEKYFSDLGSSHSEPEPDEMSGEPEYNELPPQFTDTAPQYDFSNSSVSSENNEIDNATEPEQPDQFPRSGEVTAAEPGQIENIGDIPESGNNPNEQLGRRSFENQQPPVNSRDDIKPLVQKENGSYPKFPPEPAYDTIDDFLKVNDRLGTVRFRTYTARNALPVPNATIVLFKTIGGKQHVFYNLTTDISGQTEIVSLPAPSSVLSQTPDSGVQPYSLYDANISAQGFSPVLIRNLPVFEGILSVQRAAMVPGTETESGETINEEEPNLTEVSDA